MKQYHLSKQHQTKMLRAIKEFEMISPKDRVLVGMSGGKDSAFLAYALGVIQRYCDLDFELETLTVDIGFEDKLNTDGIKTFCERNEIKSNFVTTQIADIIKLSGESNPCAKCAYFRRAAINSFAVENGFNKVALAHHEDDVVETLMMNILYSGRISTFLPNTYLTRSDLNVIRPLVYLTEKEIIRGMKSIEYTPTKNPCPYTKDTARFRVKGLIKELTIENRAVRGNIASVIRNNKNMELWPDKEGTI